MEQISPVYNRILVEVDREWNEEIKTESGVIGVCFESEIERLDGAQLKGKVVALPLAVSENILDVNKHLQVGDTVYFHFNEISQDSRIDDVFDRRLYIVMVDQLFLAIRDGEIKMLNDRVLITPMYDSDVDENTNTKIEKTASGIVVSLKREEQHNTKKGVLAHIGQTMLKVYPGDVVYYEKDADMEYIIEGTKYLVMTQEDLMMREVCESV